MHLLLYSFMNMLYLLSMCLQVVWPLGALMLNKLEGLVWGQWTNKTHRMSVGGDENQSAEHWALFSFGWLVWRYREWCWNSLEEGWCKLMSEEERFRRWAEQVQRPCCWSCCVTESVPRVLRLVLRGFLRSKQVERGMCRKGMHWFEASKVSAWSAL